MTRTKLQSYFLATGLVCSALFVGLLQRTFRKGEQKDDERRSFLASSAWTIVSVASLLATLISAVVCFHISYTRCGKFHTVSSMLMMYVFNTTMSFLSVIFKRKFDHQTKNPRLTQESILKYRMKRDANTLYGKRFHFNKINCLEDLKKQHPLTSYEHYAEYVKKMADGEENVLIGEKLQRFGITSGTTGSGKLIPLPKSRSKEALMSQVIHYWAVKEKLGQPSFLQRPVIQYVNPRSTKTASGHDVGPMHLYTDDMKGLISRMVAVPWEATSITSEFEAMYITLLFGICDPNVGHWMGPFSSQVHKAMSKLETNWKQLVHDVSTGTVDKNLQISAEVREACHKKLSPDPERAEELRREFEKGFDGIMRRIWPHLVFIFGINTADYSEKLRNGYAKDVPVIGAGYSSTEGDYGISLLWPGDEDKYVLLPSSCIYEFIPEEKINEDQPAALFIDEVQKGETYELVISTLCGFYRYRFGDVIEVVDFYNNTPVVKFMYRSGQLLNLRAEKVTEISVDEAVHHVISNMQGAKLVHWTSAESTLLATIPDEDCAIEFDKGDQFYLVFIELEDGTIDHRELDKKQQQQFDDALKQRNNYYNGFRKAGTILPPRVYLVKSGTFKALQDYIVANSTASYNQFKVPSKLKLASTLKLMLDNSKCNLEERSMMKL